jgi:hypothetical protein
MFVDAQEIPLERLEHEITSIAGQLAATTCRWLLLLAEFDRREGWMTWGSRSCAHWLSWRCGLSERTAREHVRIAHALRQLPRITELFSSGELTYSKVKALTRIATADIEDELVEFARTATAAQLDRSVSAYLASKRDPRRPKEERFLFTDTIDGIGDVRARIPAEQLAVVDAAIEEALRVLPVDDGPAGPSSIAQRRADALVLIAESFLAHGAEVRQGPERTMVVLHVDADGATAPELEDGTPLHPETACRLGCDASVVAVIEKDRVPIGVGRQTRMPNRATRRAVKARDRHCQWPGCNERRFVEIHHRKHWTDWGKTEVPNLVLLCWFHHHALHEGGFSIDADHRVFRADGVEVITGKPMPAEPIEPTVPASAVVAGWGGERLDLGLAVDGLYGVCDVPASRHECEPDRAAAAG